MIEFISDVVSRGFFIIFDRRINQYQITVHQRDTNNKMEQWLPPDHFTEGKVKAVIEYCINKIKKQNETESKRIKSTD